MSCIQFQLSMLQRSLTSRSRTSGVMRRLVMNRWLALNGLLSRLPDLITSAIELVPCQLPLMFPGAFSTSKPIGCHGHGRSRDPLSKKGVALSKRLIGDLAVEPLWVGLDRQEDVGSLLRELPKIACFVSSASAWIRMPSRSSSPSSFRRTERPWFSLLA